MLAELVAALTLVALIAYAVLAGADFGGGVWDALARGPRRDAQREAIAHAMGPVWEANHVWLIFVIVLLFTAFPTAFAALSVALFLPFHLVLLGIILRGAAFVFRAYSSPSGRSGAEALRWGAVFGGASVITPVLLGMCLGAVSAGGVRVTNGQVIVEGVPPWLDPLSLAIGIFALAICAYLAAVYLANETEGELREAFRRRALAAGTERLRLARTATVVQTACLLAGWGIAQHPYLIYPDVTIHGAAAGDSTLRFVLWSTPFGMAILLPSLWFLFRVFKGPHLALVDTNAARERTESAASPPDDDSAR